MLPSEVIELRILRYTRAGAISGWRPTSVPELANVVGVQDWGEVIGALRRLHGRRVVRMRQWQDPGGFAFHADNESKSDFFYRRGIQIEITPEGLPYFDLLEMEHHQEQGSEITKPSPPLQTDDHVPPSPAQSFRSIAESIVVPLSLGLEVGAMFRFAVEARTELEKEIAAHPIAELARGFRELT